MYEQTGTVLKVVVGWLILLVFLENIVSCFCLDKSGLWLNLVEHQPALMAHLNTGH